MPTSYAPYSVMPCQVSAQSVVANSWPLAQGSGVFGCILVSTAAACPYVSVGEKKRAAEKKTAAARTIFVLFTLPPFKNNHFKTNSRTIFFYDSKRIKISN